MRLRITHFIIALLAGTPLLCFAQGTVRGVVTDGRGEPLPFVNVYQKEVITNGTTTDFDGRYELSVPSEGAVNVVFSSVGMTQMSYAVDVDKGKVFVLNVVLEESAVMIEEGVVIEAKANRGAELYMEKMQSNAARTFDYITSQTLQKTGDSNVPDAVKRVTGVSTVGGYVSVRGLVDRYIKTTVNGSTLPTLDPFTNNVRLDMFPTGLIDNLLVVKTMTPDLPGDWAGAFLSIETKDFPDQLTVSISSNVGYNAQTSFQDIISSQGGSTDWLGFDNGFRDIPDGVPTVQQDFPRIINPNLWQQFEFLGIDDELNAYGLTASTPWTPGNIYHQIALSELGFLGPANFGNASAVQLAIDDYNATYSPGYFFTGLNGELEQIGTSFRDTWFATTRQAPVDFSQNITIGNQVKLFGRPLGFIVGGRYEMRTLYDPESVVQRTFQRPNINPDEVTTLANGLDFMQQASRETRGWSALAKLAYKPADNHQVSLLVMPNFNGQNKARRYEGIREDIVERAFGDDQFYEERRQVLYQLETTHFFPGSDLRIDVNAAYTDGERDVLDFKDIRYLQDIDVFIFNSTFNPERRFRYMDESLLDARISAELPVFKKREEKSHIKFGGAYRDNRRTNQQVSYNLVGLNEEDIQTFGFDGVFGLDRFLIQDSTRFDLSYNNISTVDDSDLGFISVTAGYGMIDYAYSERLRFVGGMRAEWSDIFVDIQQFYDDELPVDSDDRINGNGQLLNPGDIRQLDLLPSANIIYKVKDDDTGVMNLRLNYSRSLARPSFREMSAVSLYDYELLARVQGNTELEMTRINNYDLRAEAFMANGANLSVSGFYKTFENHIELIQRQGNEFTWQNAENSFVYGIEVEGKLNLTRQLDVRGNVTFLRSQTTVTIPEPKTRSMFGQAPYILNGMLSYTSDSLGFSASVSYNVQGPKLAVVASSGVEIPDVFEMPRHLVDVTLNQRLGDHWSVALRVRDLFNSPILRQYKFDAGYLLDFDRYTFGTTYNLTIRYRI